MTYETPLRELSARFQYTPDTVDNWKILKAETGPLKGDCEDFAITLAWMMSGKSIVRFWIGIFTFRYVLWHCHTNGNGHLVMWVRGYGWVDNRRGRLWNAKWPRGPEYKLLFPHTLPTVAIKMLYSVIVRKVKGI